MIDVIATENAATTEPWAAELDVPLNVLVGSGRDSERDSSVAYGDLYSPRVVDVMRRCLVGPVGPPHFDRRDGPGS